MTDLGMFCEQKDQLSSLIHNYTASTSNCRRSRSRSGIVRWVLDQPWTFQPRSLSNLITVRCHLDEESKAFLTGMEATVIVSWQYEESNEVRNVLIPSFWSAEIIATGKGVHPFMLDKLKIGAYETVHSKLEQTVDEKTKDTTIHYAFIQPENARRLIGTLSFGSTFEGTAVEAEVKLPVGTLTDPLPAIRKITRNAIDTLVRLKERKSEASTDEADTFELRFRDTSFVTDRFTLEEHSQFFGCFFSSCFSFKEHNQGYIESDLDPEVGEIIQTYLTTGRIEKVKLEENLEGFMQFVHEKQFLELVAIGEVMMVQSALDALTDKDMQGIVGILSLGAQLDLTMIVLLGNLLEQEYFSGQGEEEVGREWELSDGDHETWSGFLANAPLYNAKKHTATNVGIRIWNSGRWILSRSFSQVAHASPNTKKAVRKARIGRNRSA